MGNRGLYTKVKEGSDQGDRIKKYRTSWKGVEYWWEINTITITITLKGILIFQSILIARLGGKDTEAQPKTCVSIDEWIDVWGMLVGKAKKMDDFPMWLQYYPKVLFDVINRSGEGRYVN